MCRSMVDIQSATADIRQVVCYTEVRPGLSGKKTKNEVALQGAEITMVRWMCNADLDWPLCHGTGAPFDSIFYLVGFAAYRQYMFCILYSCVFWTIFLHVFMHVNVSGRSVLLLNKLIDWTQTSFEKNENKKFRKLGLLNYPKRICNNPNPKPAMLQFIVYLIISPCMPQWNNLVH